MKRHYNELMNTNRDIIQGYKIRSSNHEELLKHVKTLNQVVQRAGNLRGICVYFTLNDSDQISKCCMAPFSNSK